MRCSWSASGTRRAARTFIAKPQWGSTADERTYASRPFSGSRRCRLPGRPCPRSARRRAARPVTSHVEVVKTQRKSECLDAARSGDAPAEMRRSRARNEPFPIGADCPHCVRSRARTRDRRDRHPGAVRATRSRLAAGTLRARRLCSSSARPRCPVPGDTGSRHSGASIRTDGPRRFRQVGAPRRIGHHGAATPGQPQIPWLSWRVPGVLLY